MTLRGIEERQGGQGQQWGPGQLGRRRTEVLIPEPLRAAAFRQRQVRQNGNQQPICACLITVRQCSARRRTAAMT